MSNFVKFYLDFGKMTYGLTFLQHVGGEVAFCPAVRYNLQNA